MSVTTWKRSDKYGELKVVDGLETIYQNLKVDSVFKWKPMKLMWGGFVNSGQSLHLDV